MSNFKHHAWNWVNSLFALVVTVALLPVIITGVLWLAGSVEKKMEGY